MPPTLILIRHAEALHNETKDYDIHDPDLTRLGQSQCLDLRKSLIENPLAQQAGLIVVSPMRRAIQTALLSVGWLIEKGVRIEADASWQENSNKPCDTGSPIAKLTQEFPSVDFTTALDPIYPDKTSPAAAQYHYARTAVLNRAQAALKRLYACPEKVIIVVAHSAFLRLAVTGCFFFNADYRIFDFAQPEEAGGEKEGGGAKEGLLEVVQHLSTKENGGGLGRSWTEQVVLGSDLHDEMPPADAA